MSAAVPSKDAAGSAYRVLMQHTDIQSSFPGFEPPKPPGWLLPLLQFLQKHWGFLSSASWVVAALIALAVIAILVRQFWPVLSDRMPKPKPAAAQAEWRPSAAQARQLLEEADALAARGHFTDAVHLLLLRSIEDIEKHRPRLIRVTLTSREISLLQALPDAARAAFTGIARVVERSLFAGEEIGPAEFRWCRGEYESFAFPQVWQNAQ